MLGRNAKVLLCLSGLVLTVGLATSALVASSDEPISYIGHGAMFDKGGVELAPSLRTIGRAQSWYLATLTQRLSKEDRVRFAQLQRRVIIGTQPDQQARLVVEARPNMLLRDVWLWCGRFWCLFLWVVGDLTLRLGAPILTSVWYSIGLQPFLSMRYMLFNL